MAMTPMVLTARLIKQRHPDSRIVFIGPCLAKKKEASRRAVKSYVDFVLTYEELDGMFKAKDVDFEAIEDSTPPLRASADAFGFARSGGVAQAVVNHVRRIDPDREVKIVKAEGLDECMKMMRKAAKGEYDGYLLEGMACPGGCIAGAGTMQPVTKSSVTLDLKMKSMPVENSTDTAFAHMLKSLENYPEIMEIDPFEDL
jgi:iron only hydrogenase large subunit-like protein